MTEQELLHGNKIFLRALEPADLELLYKWENNTSLWNTSETLSPISKFILKRYLENAHKDIYENKQLRLMIQLTKENRPVGTIDLFDFDHYHKRAAVGILIAEDTDRKKGYASEALELIGNYCFEHLNLNQIYCTISKKNSPSLELFKNAGFRITGTREKWNWTSEGYTDEYFLQRIR